MPKALWVPPVWLRTVRRHGVQNNSYPISDWKENELSKPHHKYRHNISSGIQPLSLSLLGVNETNEQNEKGEAEEAAGSDAHHVTWYCRHNIKNTWDRMDGKTNCVSNVMHDIDQLVVWYDGSESCSCSNTHRNLSVSSGLSRERPAGQQRRTLLPNYCWSTLSTDCVFG